MAGRVWTIDDAPRLDGRRAIVTGASGGLGFETALGLARRGARVVLAARNPAKAEVALARIHAAVPRATVSFSHLDLADLSSVRAFAEDVMVGGEGLDILVNNAGVMAYPTRRTTRDGFEEQFGTNYLGHFALTAHLLPALLGASSEARVVSLASLAHVQGRDRARRSARREAVRWLDGLSAEQARHADLRPRVSAPRRCRRLGDPLSRGPSGMGRHRHHHQWPCRRARRAEAHADEPRLPPVRPIGG